MEELETGRQVKVMQEEIDALKSEFCAVSCEVKELGNGQRQANEAMDGLRVNLEKINSSLEEMMEKLGAISEANQKSAVEDMLHKGGGFFSELVGKPLRKLAVGTVGTVMMVGEFAAEKLAYAREGMEDIVAEASYNNKMRGQNQKTEA
jgi:hypothetical protein